MAAFTPDQERAAALRGPGKLPAAGRGLLSTALAGDRHRDSMGQQSSPSSAGTALTMRGHLAPCLSPRRPAAGACQAVPPPLAFAAGQGRGNPKPGPHVAQLEPCPASGMFQFCGGGTTMSSSTNTVLCSLAIGDGTGCQAASKPGL